MKNIIGLLFVCIIVNFSAMAGNYTWTGTTNTSWGTSTNWSPNGNPGTSDTININSTTNSLTLTAKKTVKRLVMNSGIVNLGGDTLVVSTSSGLNGGTINNGLFNPNCTGLVNFNGTTFGAAVYALGQIKLNGCVFNSTAYFEHNSASSGTGAGGNTFNGVTTLKNSGTTILRTADSNSDTFNADVYLVNVSSGGSGYFSMSYGAATYFNGNVVVTCTSSLGINFSSAGYGSTALASGKTLTIGNGGFTGTLAIKNFTQSGTTSQNLTFSSKLNLVNATFNGALTSSVENFVLSDCNFINTANFTKNGNTSDYSSGNNIFHENVTFTNSASSTSATMRLSADFGNKFYKDATFNTTNGQIQVVYDDTTEFKGNVSINNSKVNFNQGAGYVMCTSGSSQEFDGSANYAIGKLIINKSANELTLQRAATIDSSLKFTNGIIFTDSINLLTLKAGSVCSGASNLSYVDGPVKKIGNTSFEFPVGDDDTFKGLFISGVGSVTDAYICEFVNHGYGNILHDTSLVSLNNCLFWSLERKVGTSTPQIKIMWSSNDCFITNPSTMRLASFEGSLWKDKGYIQSTGTSLFGTVTGLNGNWNRYLTFANVYDTTTISNQVLLNEVGLFSLLDSINPLGNLHVSGKVVSLWNGDVSSFGGISISDSVFTSYTDEYLKISEALTGKDYNSLTINDGDSISGGGYYYLNEDSLIQGLFLSGDSTDKFFIKGGTSLVIGNSGKVVLNGIRRENVFWLLNDLKLDSNSCMYGIVFSNRVELTKEHVGIIQLFSRESLAFSSSETFNNAIYLKSLDFINEDLRLDYNVINPQTLPCNKIFNGDLELGIVPIGINAIKANYASFWDATSWINVSSCNSGGPGANTPDLLDIAFTPSSFVSCVGQNGGVGIPISFASNNVVNVRLPNSTRYLHSLESETANVQLDPSINGSPGVYLFEFYHSFGNCYSPAPGTSLNSCIGLLPIGSNISITPLILANSNLNTFNWLGQNVTPGTWIQDLVCLDLSTSVIPNLATYNRIGIKPEVQGAGIQREIFFDDFQLVKVADAGQDKNICIGGYAAIGDLDNCLSSVSGVQVDYLWTASPAYTWGTGQNQNTLINPVVNPTQTTVFTLTVTVTYPDGITSCTDHDDMTVFVANALTPIVYFNLPSPYSLCQGQSVNLCTTGSFVSYNWSSGPTTQCITVSSAGTYTLTVVDQNGCSGLNSIDIVEIPCCSLTVDLTAENACLPATVGSITGDLANGTAPYNIVWQQTSGGTASGNFNTSANPFSITNLAPGTYSVTVTDADGCTDMATVTIVSSANPPLASILGSSSACVGTTSLFAVNNPQTGFTYSWSYDPTFSTLGATVTFTTVSSSSFNATFSDLSSNYLIQVTSTNTNGCSSTSTFSVNGCCTQENELTIIDGFSSTINTSFPYFKISGIFTVNSNVTWNGNNILMDNGAEIRVLPGFTLTLNNVYIHPCDRFWKSITIQQSGNIISNNSILQGGQYAIDVNSGGGYFISSGTRFWDNYVGLRVQGAFSNGNARIFESSIIRLAPTNSLYNSLADYINQSPPSGNTTSCNAMPFAGIVLNFAGANNVGSNLINGKTIIQDAMFGIHSTNTFLRVMQTDIKNCWNDPCQPLNQINGSGIYATTGFSTGNIWVSDFGLGQAFRNNISDCFFGIRTNGLAPIVRENSFDNVVDGIRATAMPPHFLANRMEISDNNIKYGRFGVRVLNSPAAFRTDFNYNYFEDITTMGAFTGFRGAINVVGNRFVGSEFDGGGGNTIHLNLLRQGIYAAATSLTSVGENEIFLNSPSWQRGILLEGCDDILVMSNTIIGNINSLPFNRVGIDIRASGLINKNENDYLCNEVNYCSSNIRMEQNSTNMDFGFNVMRDGNRGLNLIGTIMGSQDDKFNKWCGTFNNEAILVDQGSNASFRIPPSLPPTPAGCNYNPFNNGGVNGAGFINIDPTGTNVDPICENTNHGESAIITSWDYFIADSLENIELDQNYKNQLKRQLIQKLVYHTSLKESDSSMMAFWISNTESDGMKLALMDSAIRNIYSSASSSFDEATVYSQLVDTNLRLIQILDSLLSTGLSYNDSLDLLRTRDQYSILIDSLFMVIDSLVNQGNVLLIVKADEMIATLSELDLTTEMGNYERDYQIFVLKYGPWTSTIIAAEDSAIMVNLAHLCMKEYGPVVAWARKWIVEWFDEYLEDDELCNNSYRLSHTNTVDIPYLNIKLYPNPASDEVKIELNQWKDEYLGQLYVKIYTLQGQLINSYQLLGKLSNLVLGNSLPGAYLVEVVLNGNVESRKKLIIVK